MILGKVGEIPLVNIRKEFYCKHGRTMSLNTNQFNLPCCHTLVSIDREYLYLMDIPSRWWLTDENIDDSAERNDEALATQSLAWNPWMKYVRALEEYFRKYEGDSSRMDSLSEAMIELLNKDNDGISNLSALPKNYADPNFIRYKANIRAEKRKIDCSEGSVNDKKTVTGKDTFNPKSDGFCGFRSAAYLIYGKESCYTFNKDIYGTRLKLDVELGEATTTKGIDRTMSEIEKADKKEKLSDVPFSHQNAMRARIGHWFSTSGCS
ncbi:hypothetical protein BDB01DRAFT_899429 [Pilobolus umbonatus]|nr:hypothetical protein BDB01DRAFT_899429 [Pilobolus umbonatus]